MNHFGLIKMHDHGNDERNVAMVRRESLLGNGELECRFFIY